MLLLPVLVLVKTTMSIIVFSYKKGSKAAAFFIINDDACTGIKERRV